MHTVLQTRRLGKAEFPPCDVSSLKGLSVPTKLLLAAFFRSDQRKSVANGYRPHQGRSLISVGQLLVEGFLLIKIAFQCSENRLW